MLDVCRGCAQENAVGTDGHFVRTGHPADPAICRDSYLGLENESGALLRSSRRFMGVARKSAANVACGNGASIPV